MQPEVHGTRPIEKDLSNLGIDDQLDHDWRVALRVCADHEHPISLNFPHRYLEKRNAIGDKNTILIDVTRCFAVGLAVTPAEPDAF